ncbi:hypothetical protein AB0L88_40990 [Saccharopolyspora shandongensis]|uniref:hypothetical protein n=1 Tax=Saccharopolyspora shandongensis TaxID=418495 RepID=UPI003413BD22
MALAKILKRASLSAMAVGVLASGAALGLTAPASAAGAGSLTVCSKGDYASYVQFPSRGGMATTIVNAGECRDFNNLGSSNNVEQINVFGVQGPSTFWIQSGSFRASKGGNVHTYGSSADAWAMTPQV